jgi:hypothetical protein
MAKEQESNGVQMTNDQLMELIKAMKAPSVFEQRKLDEEERQRIQKEKFRVDMAKAETEQQRNTQMSCAHHNGRHPLFVGQKCTNGDFTAQCLRCQAEYRFSAAQLPEGFQLSEQTAMMPIGQCQRWLEQMEKQHPPKIEAKRYRPEVATK